MGRGWRKTSGQQPLLFQDRQKVIAFLKKKPDILYIKCTVAGYRKMKLHKAQIVMNHHTMLNYLCAAILFL